MTEYHYTTYRMQTMVSLEGDELVLTPKQQRAIREQLNAAIERSMIEALTGGYYVPSLHEGSKGVTIQHVCRTQPLLSDSRQESREGSLGPDQPRATERTSENQSEG